MRTIYEIEVRAQCPVNPKDIDLYQFTIESNDIIEVEYIARFFRDHAGDTQVFQEELTRKAAVTIGARVRSVGHHSGIKVTCEAP